MNEQNEIDTTPVHKSALLIRLGIIEEELAEIKAKLLRPQPAQPVVSTRGIWRDLDITDEELEEVTHPQRTIDRLKAENLALRQELDELRRQLSA